MRYQNADVILVPARAEGVRPGILAHGPRARAVAAGLSVLVALALASTAAAAPTLRIAVVHDDGNSGLRTLEGVKAAVDAYGDGPDPRFDVEVVGHAYSREAQGLELLLEIADAQADGKKGSPFSAQIVIGPTDSGVYVDLADHADRLARGRVPIISSLVTADVDEARDGWRFRTNVNVVLRAKEISEFLGQRGFGPLSVLYAETGFGKLAEAEFKSGLSQEVRDIYHAYPYRGVRDLQAPRTLLRERPWAVGVFGPRHMIRDVRDDLRARNQSWYTYDPVIFSIIDASAICEPDIFFVSLATLASGPCSGERSPDSDEAYGLAYDTAALVLDVAAGAGSDPGAPGWTARFRSRFSKLLDGQERPPGEKTGMTFAGRENRAPLGVFTAQDGQVLEPSPPQVGPVRRTIGNWLSVRQRRFGGAPLLNLLLVIVVVGALTFSDAGRWFTGRLWELPRWGPFRRLLYFNVGLALAAFVVTAESETGPFRWDHLFGALVVALGYPALLKTTLFETPAGRRLGVSGMYDRWLRRINDQIMMMRFKRDHDRVDFIAQTNSLASLKDVLRSVYHRAKTRERREELISSLEDELSQLPEGVERKRLCAERLLGLMPWDELKNLHLVPDEIDDPADLIGPDSILRAAVGHCMARDDGGDVVDGSLSEHFAKLGKRSPETAQRDRAQLEAEVAVAGTERGIIYRHLRYLFTQWNYDLERIEGAGLISEAFREDELARRRHPKPRLLDKLRWRPRGRRAAPPSGVE